MLVIKGVLLVFGLFIMALIVFVVLGRGGMFDARFFTKAGSFLIGVGLGTGAVGCVLLLLGRAVMAHFARVVQ
jgi:hypothetical protein